MLPKFFVFVLLFIPVPAYRCVNFYGLEVPQKKFVCSWVHEPKWYLEKMKKLIKIDSVRIPFSYEYASCSDFRELDNFIRDCQNLEISVILDYHRGYSDHQGPSPVENGITKAMWIDMLIHVLERYHDQPHVKAITLFNEFQGTDYMTWQAMQLEAVTSLEDIFPGRYEYMLGCVDWGKDCSNMWNKVPNERSYIEIHSYGFGLGRYPNNRNKIFVGEIGWRANETSNFQEFKTIVRKRRIRDICLWTVAHSDDTKSLFQNDCETVNTDIQNDFNSLFDWNNISCLRGSKI